MNLCDKHTIPEGTVRVVMMTCMPTCPFCIEEERTKYIAKLERLLAEACAILRENRDALCSRSIQPGFDRCGGCAGCKRVNALLSMEGQK